MLGTPPSTSCGKRCWTPEALSFLRATQSVHSCPGPNPEGSAQPSRASWLSCRLICLCSFSVFCSISKILLQGLLNLKVKLLQVSGISRPSARLCPQIVFQEQSRLRRGSKHPWLHSAPSCIWEVCFPSCSFVRFCKASSRRESRKLWPVSSPISWGRQLWNSPRHQPGSVCGCKNWDWDSLYGTCSCQRGS